MSRWISYLDCWPLPPGPAAQCTQPGSAPGRAAGSGPGSGSPSLARKAEPRSAHTHSTPWTSWLVRPPDLETSWSERRAEGRPTVVLLAWTETCKQQLVDHFHSEVIVKLVEGDSGLLRGVVGVGQLVKLSWSTLLPFLALSLLAGTAGQQSMLGTKNCLTSNRCWVYSCRRGFCTVFSCLLISAGDGLQRALLVRHELLSAT